MIYGNLHSLPPHQFHCRNRPKVATSYNQHAAGGETEAREMKCLAWGYRAASGQENLDPGFSDSRAQGLIFHRLPGVAEAWGRGAAGAGRDERACVVLGLWVPRADGAQWEWEEVKGGAGKPAWPSQPLAGSTFACWARQWAGGSSLQGLRWRLGARPSWRWFLRAGIKQPAWLPECVTEKDPQGQGRHSPPPPAPTWSPALASCL